MLRIGARGSLVISRGKTFPPGNPLEGSDRGRLLLSPWKFPGGNLEVALLAFPRSGFLGNPTSLPGGAKNCKICDCPLTSIKVIFPTVQTVLCHLVFSMKSPRWAYFLQITRELPGSSQVISRKRRLFDCFSPAFPLEIPWCFPGVFRVWPRVPAQNNRMHRDFCHVSGWNSRKTPGNHLEEIGFPAFPQEVSRKMLGFRANIPIGILRFPRIPRRPLEKSGGAPVPFLIPNDSISISSFLVPDS